MDILLVPIIFLSTNLHMTTSTSLDTPINLNVTNQIEVTLQSQTHTNSIQALYKLMYDKHVTFSPKSNIPVPFPSTLTTPPITEVKHYVYFAAASYCEGQQLSEWTCSECRLTGSSVQLLQLFINKSKGTQGFIALDHSKQEFILAFRGTHNFINAIDQDFIYHMIPSPLKDGAKIHGGYFNATMSLYPHIIPIIRNLTTQYPGFRVVLTGHSLGGSMATLTYYLLSHDLPGIDYAVFTYGQSRLGDKGFADVINGKRIPFARVVNENDVVPHGASPASLGFVHHQTEYWTRNGRTRVCARVYYEDPNCSMSQKKDQLTWSAHMTYMGISVGLNCLTENPLGQTGAILTGGR